MKDPKPNYQLMSLRGERRREAVAAAVGISAARAVHRRLPVSFQMVRQVVEHGQCARENSAMHTAVSPVQPLSVSSCPRPARLSHSVRVPLER